MDPLVETFSTFSQELRGTEQILCICDNEKAFTSWKDLIKARCGNDISGRCIYELNFAEVNGTVLSLLSKNRRSSRFLPCGGGSQVLLEKKVERSLSTLEILCMNQCEGGNEDKIAIEQNFYKGGKVSWWNFYFSEQPGSTPFIKRDKFDFIMNTVIPDLCSLRKACVLFNLMHVPGCGGTTLAMHMLWALRDRFRCAVLRDSNADFAEVAEQVVKLLMYDHEEQLPRVPLLLMIDDFDDMEKVNDLQQLIEKECVKKDIQSKSAQEFLGLQPKPFCGTIKVEEGFGKFSTLIASSSVEILGKTPVFSSENVRHDIMSKVLSGDIKLQDAERYDPRNTKHRTYYIILRQFEDVLYNLKYRMKMNFDFLDNFYVNLGSRSGMKDSREQVAQNELFRCFRQYVNLFCKTDSTSLLKNKTMSYMLQLHETRQFLEKQKADTYSGILNYLSNDTSAEKLEKIVRMYDFVGASQTVKEKINYIYVNVVLSRIKLESTRIQPYPKLIGLLLQVQREKIPLSENLPLLFIAVVLLWPQENGPPCRGLGKYISQMRTSYHTEMKEVYNGKRPIVHFFLGKKRGYERLVHLGEIKRCCMAEEGQFISMWENGKLWKEKKVEELLCRVTGTVKGKFILADTCIPDLKFEVTPMFRWQLSGYGEGSKVSFFIGFSMRGPLALDIN
eukprot:superscaffoldBa00012701_g25748